MPAYIVHPVAHPLNGTFRPPGSKSITNRAMILAALADGTTTLTGVLDSQDTRVMIESLRRLGFQVEQDIPGCTCTVSGLAGKIPQNTLTFGWKTAAQAFVF